MDTIVTDHTIKRKLYDIARQNYADAISFDDDQSWGLKKIRYDKKIQLTTVTKCPCVYYHTEFYDYSPKLDGSPNLWTVFSNKRLGGRYKGDGWVQEEIIDMEFYEMALGIQNLKDTGDGLMKLKEVFLAQNLIRSSIVNPESYGELELAKLIKPNIINTADFLCIDAPKRENIEDPYTIDNFRHIFVKSLVGFETCVYNGYDIINTGNWGCGVYNNREDLIYLSQYISAWLAGVNEIHYWGYREDDKYPHKERLTNLLIHGGKDIEEFLEEALDLCGMKEMDLEYIYRDLM